MKEKKAKRNVWASDYRPYGTYRGPRGNPAQWANAFKARFSDAEIKEIIGDDDPWSILGLKPGATQADIKAAFRKKAYEWHPDVNPGKPEAAAMFRKCRAAYERLTPE